MGVRPLFSRRNLDDSEKLFRVVNHNDKKVLELFIIGGAQRRHLAE
jgi:hypothetical protein